MANTIEINVPEETWTLISAGLTQGTAYSLQNRGSNDIRIIEQDSLPTTGQGRLIYPRDAVTIRPQSGFGIYVFAEDAGGTVVINEAV